MNIKVMSKFEAIEYNYREDIQNNYIIISISSIDTEEHVLFSPNNKCKGVIRLKFNDLERDYGDKIRAPRQGDFSGLKMFIDDFVERGNIEDIIVHCEAGISRSSALGAVIAQYLGLDEFNLIWNNDKYIPNERVYRLASNEFGLKICEAQLGFYKGIKKQLLDEIDLPINL